MLGQQDRRPGVSRLKYVAYISAMAASEKWVVSLSQVQRLLANNRIPRAKKYGRSWMIPDNEEKPADPRMEKKPPQQSLSSDLAHVIEATSIPMPSKKPDAILKIVKDERSRLQYEGELVDAGFFNFKRTLA